MWKTLEESLFATSQPTLMLPISRSITEFSLYIFLLPLTKNVYTVYLLAFFRTPDLFQHSEL